MNVEPPVGPFVSIFRLLYSIVGTTFLATVCSDSVNFVRSSTTASLDLGEILLSSLHGVKLCYISHFTRSTDCSTKYIVCLLCSIAARI